MKCKKCGRDFYVSYRNEISSENVTGVIFIKGVKLLDSKQWNLFDYNEVAVIEPTDKVDLKEAIATLQAGEQLQHGRYTITKNKYFEIEYANEYHELFHTEQLLFQFLTAKGLI